MTWWIMVGIIILLVFMLLVSRLYITFQYIYDHGSDGIYIVVRLYNIRIYQRKLNLSHVLSQSTTWKNWNDKTLLERIQYAPKGIKTTFKQFQEKYEMTLQQFQNIHIRRFDWKTECGTGNAATTGMVSGAIWSAKGMLVGLLKNKLNRASQPNIKVIPYFQQPIMTSQMHCIVSITIGKAIRAYFQTKHPHKRKKLQD